MFKAGLLQGCCKMIAVSGSCFDTTVFIIYIPKDRTEHTNNCSYSHSDCSVYTGLFVITVCHSMATIYTLYQIALQEPLGFC